MPLAYDARGDFISVMCSSMTESVSLMTGESEVIVKLLAPAVAEPGKDVRSAVDATEDCGLITSESAVWGAAAGFCCCCCCLDDAASAAAAPCAAVIGALLLLLVRNLFGVVSVPLGAGVV